MMAAVGWRPLTLAYTPSWSDAPSPVTEATGPVIWSSKGPTWLPSSTSRPVSAAATIWPVSASRPRCRSYGAGGAEMAPSSLDNRRSCPMPKPADLNRCLAALDQDHTIIAVIEMSQSNWLVAGVVPGIARHPLKKLAPDQDALLKLLHRWRAEAGQAGREISRIAVAFEAGRDGFWLARWLRAHGIEAHVIHPTSVAVSREHRRAKTDRLDTALLKRVFLGWLRGEPEHCHMAAIPTLADEDARRPTRERECLVGERTRIVNRIKAALARPGRAGLQADRAQGPGAS